MPNKLRFDRIEHLRGELELAFKRYTLVNKSNLNTYSITRLLSMRGLYSEVEFTVVYNVQPQEYQKITIQEPLLNQFNKTLYDLFLYIFNIIMIHLKETFIVLDENSPELAKVLYCVNDNA